MVPLIYPQLALALPSLSNIINNAYAIVLVVLGIGFVIFIHELGHFLVAKWAGVKVEIFSLGFGPTLVSWRKGFGFRRGSTIRDYETAIEASDDATQAQALEKYGETEYSLRILPLGGFVKMLGEGDEGEPRTTDPRAFDNKPVGARMAIMSAGVIMNLIFGLICATWVHIRGKLETPAIAGTVVAGQTAYDAGLRPGDEIVSIDGRTDLSFDDIYKSVPLGAAGKKIKFEIRRAGHEGLIPMEIEPKRQANAQTATIGVGPPESLDLLGKQPKGLVADENQFDRVQSAGPEGATPTKVSRIEELNAILVRERSRPIVIGAERGTNDEDEIRDKKPKSHVDVTIPPKPFVDFGMRMTPGPVRAIRPDSPASRAGLRAGDLIVAFDGARDYDPLRLPDMAYDRAGKATQVEVRRGNDLIKLDVTPDETPIWRETPSASEPLEVPGLGLAVTIEPKVAAVTPSSPAAKAGIAAGDVVKAVEFANPREKDDKKVTWTKPLALDGKAAAWPIVFESAQRDDDPIRLQFEGKKDPIELTAAPVADWFNPSHGLSFATPLQTRHAPEPLGVALQKGWRDTLDTGLSIFAVLRNMATGQLGTGAIGGPVMIANLAHKVAKAGGFGGFLPFLGMLSINLAVINLLPIPVLDGGRILFLMAEKVRGRPLPDRAVVYPMVAGVVFLIVLFVVISIKDVWSLL